MYKPAAPAGSSQKSKGKGKGKAKAPSFDDMDDVDDMDKDQFGEEQDGDEDEGEFDEGDSDEFADEEDDLFDPNEDGTDITTRAKGGYKKIGVTVSLMFRTQAECDREEGMYRHLRRRPRRQAGPRRD